MQKSQHKGWLSPQSTHPSQFPPTTINTATYPNSKHTEDIIIHSLSILNITASPDPYAQSNTSRHSEDSICLTTLYSFSLPDMEMEEVMEVDIGVAE